MKQTLCAGLISAILWQCGCQSTNWSANNKSSTKSTLAQNDAARDIPWSANGKKKPGTSADLPPEIAAKFERGKQTSKSAADWVAEGVQQEVAHDLTGARSSYEAALAVDPDHANAHHRLAILADMRSDFGSAQEHYEAALRQKPSDPNLLSDLGYSNYLRGKPEQGERFLLQALEADSKHRQALKNLGTLYASQSRYEDALAAFRRHRPEESQQLITQFFPNGRPIPASDVGKLASARGADSGQNGEVASTGTIDQASLNRMSREEMQLLKGQLEQKLQSRELATSSKNSPFPAGTTGQADSSPAADGDWPAISAAQSTSSPPNSAKGAIQPASSSGGPPANVASRDPKSDMPFWEGTPRGQAANMSGNPDLPPGLQPSMTDTDSEADWWSANAARIKSGEKPVSSTRSGDAGRISDDAAPNSFAGSRLAAQGPGVGAQNTPTSSISNPQWAYQVGMSAGPGTLFPVMANYAPDADAVKDASAGSAMNLRGSGPETRAPAPPPESLAPVDSDDLQWQTMPGESAPRSSSEGGGTHTTVPWPENSTSQNSPGAAGRTVKSREMPVITPGGSSTPWGTTAANHRRRSDVNRTSAADDGNASGSNSGVVPAWYDAPATTRPSSDRAFPAK